MTKKDHEEYLSKFNEIKAVDHKPTELTNIDFFTVAKGRRSVRHYDPSYKMAEEEIRELLEIAILAPSSSNLQPWRFLIIHSDEEKQKLFPIANNQQQIADASAVIAVLGDIESYKKAGEIYDLPVKEGRMTKETRDFYVNFITNNYGGLTEEKATKIVSIDGGLVAMQLMLTAKAKGYDTVPIGGFHHEQFVSEFNVPQTYKPIMLICLGKALQDGFKPNRLPIETLIAWNRY